MLGVWARLADFDFGSPIITLGFHLNGSFSLVRMKAILRPWGGFGALGLGGWAGAGQCCEFGPDWDLGILGFWDFGILETWDFGNLESWKLGILESCG